MAHDGFVDYDAGPTHAPRWRTQTLTVSACSTTQGIPANGGPGVVRRDTLSLIKHRARSLASLSRPSSRPTFPMNPSVSHPVMSTACSLRPWPLTWGPSDDVTRIRARVENHLRGAIREEGSISMTAPLLNPNPDLSDGWWTRAPTHAGTAVGWNEALTHEAE